MSTKRENRLASMIQARGDVGASAGRDASTPSRLDVGTLEKMNVSMPTALADGLRHWALDERVTVAALVEALTAAALDDPELRARVAPTARDITSVRRARK